MKRFTKVDKIELPTASVRPDEVESFIEEVKMVEKTIAVEPEIELLSVVMFTTQRFLVGGTEKVFVTTQTAPLRGFLVDVDKITLSTKLVQQIDPQEHTEVYNWQRELEVIFSDIETVRRNALLSFWRAGAFDKSALKSPVLRGEMFRHAYPYGFKE